LGKEKVKYRNTYRRVVYQVDDIAVAAGNCHSSRARLRRLWGAAWELGSVLQRPSWNRGEHIWVGVMVSFG